jgi:hypothetical protein
MGPSILVIALVPPEQFAQTMRRVRQDYVGARVVALVASADREARLSACPADEYLVWRALRPLALIRRIRRRGFELAFVAHGSDQYATFAYWKAAAVALTSRARRKLFCQFADAEGQGPVAGETAAAMGEPVSATRGVLGGVVRALADIAASAYVSVMGVALLMPVLVAITVTDLTEAASGRSGGRARER